MSERSHIVYINNINATGATWSAPVNVPFLVDEVIVKQFSYQSHDVGAGEDFLMFTLSSDIIAQPGVPLCTFIRGASITPGIRFKLFGQPVSGTYQFTTSEGNGDNIELLGYIGLHLEFIRYGKNCKCIDYK